MPTNFSIAYSLGEMLLEFFNAEKDQGVDITPKLSWNIQCDRIFSKAYKKLGVVRRNGHIVSDVTCQIP